MKKTGIILLLALTGLYTGFGQVTETQRPGMFFHGIIRDASTLSPLAEFAYHYKQDFKLSQ